MRSARLFGLFVLVVVMLGLGLVVWLRTGTFRDPTPSGVMEYSLFSKLRIH